ncbi:hypothetical protein [Sinanaerobacter sp. ZZT-01]|uniref:hypothetical protein n=1 Tax=Sinanaerobacter sp. ZZT-01 TaxID=3111540 RepID=UPI002D78C0B8|nr:hypothetical protein [Sinanaerobacter sp. ZZT-01]WRR92893.1 hypothetical protein U5921_12750 [Sinanaerobacter sp. ZZT-01]
MLKYLPYVLLTALATMFIYGWGLIKMQRQTRDLLSMLYSKCERKVRKQLQKKGKMTLKEIEGLIKGTQVSFFYSKQRLGVTDEKTFAKSMLSHMKENGMLTENYEKGKRTYSLAEKTK